MEQNTKNMIEYKYRSHCCTVGEYEREFCHFCGKFISNGYFEKFDKYGFVNSAAICYNCLPKYQDAAKKGEYVRLLDGM